MRQVFKSRGDAGSAVQLLIKYRMGAFLDSHSILKDANSVECVDMRVSHGSTRAQDAQGFIEVYRGPERSYKVTKLQPGVRYTSRVQVRCPVLYKIKYPPCAPKLRVAIVPP